MIDTPVPTITDPRDAVIRVTGSTVCGSDLHLYHAEIMQQQYGEILGHEFCGIVDEVGPECKLKVGQRVVASFQIACGTCEYCQK
jgi:threonine dehydrogenase-like Zn-dependent dehydrogenase